MNFLFYKVGKYVCKAGVFLKDDHSVAFLLQEFPTHSGSSEIWFNWETYKITNSKNWGINSNEQNVRSIPAWQTSSKGED